MAVPSWPAGTWPQPRVRPNCESACGSESTRRGEVGLAFAFLAPSLVIFVLFFYWPFARLVGWGTYSPKNRGKVLRIRRSVQLHRPLLV